MFPNALLHWEDFGEANARRILDRYRDEVCTFNDDMQGHRGNCLRGDPVRRAGHGQAVGRPPGTRVRCWYGRGGNRRPDPRRDRESGYSQEEACRRIWLIDRPGLLTDDMDDLRDYHRPYARPAAEVRDLERDPEGGISLLEAVRHVRPTILVGTSTVQGAFTEAGRAGDAPTCPAPVHPADVQSDILAEAVPADLLHWTDGQA